MSQQLNRTLIIPAAGTASRLRGLPKFLLPTHTNSVTLIERHLSHLRDYFSEILIGVNPDFSKNLNSIISEDSQIKIYEMSTKTMMETVTLLTEKSTNDSYMLIMPDTYFSDYTEIEAYLETENLDEAALLCWRIKDYQMGKLGQTLIDEMNHVVKIQDKDPLSFFEFFWGIAIFTKEHLLNAIDSDSHIGFLYERLIEKTIPIDGITISGDYYDCGTQEEYIKMLLNTKID